MLAELTGQDAAIKAAAPAQSIVQTETDASEGTQTKAELAVHAEKVRDEGLSVKPYLKSKIQITLEIDEDGSSKSFETEGGSTIKDQEFEKNSKNLEESRAKDKNKLGKGGFNIALQKPSKFHDNISLVVMPDPTDEKTMMVQKFSTQNS